MSATLPVSVGDDKTDDLVALGVDREGAADLQLLGGGVLGVDENLVGRDWR